MVSELFNKFKSELTAQIITAFSGLVLYVALARLLSPEGYGVLFLAISIFGIFEVFSQLGFGRSAGKYISQYKETDSTQVIHIFKQSAFMNMITILIVCFILLIFHRHISNLLEEPQLSELLLIGVLFIAFSSSVKYIRFTLQGLEKIQMSALVQSLNQSLRVIFAILLTITSFGAAGALFGYILAFIIASIIGSVLLYKYLISNFKPGDPEQGLRRRIFEYSLPITVTTTASAIDQRVDILLVGFFLNPTAVAFYTIGKQVTAFIKTPMKALGFTLAPTYGSDSAKDRLERSSKLYQNSLMVGLFAYIPAAVGIIITAEVALLYVFGQEYVGAAPVLQVLAIYGIFVAVTDLTTNGLDYLGRARERAVVKFICSIINLVLNIILIPVFGVIGAAVSTVISYGIYTFTVVYIISREFDLNIGKVTNSLINVVFITSIMAIVVEYLIRYVEGIGTLLLTIFSGIAVWFILGISTGEINTEKINELI